MRRIFLCFFTAFCCFVGFSPHLSEPARGADEAFPELGLRVLMPEGWVKVTPDPVLRDVTDGVIPGLKLRLIAALVIPNEREPIPELPEYAVDLWEVVETESVRLEQAMACFKELQSKLTERPGNGIAVEQPFARDLGSFKVAVLRVHYFDRQQYRGSMEYLALAEQKRVNNKVVSVEPVSAIISVYHDTSQEKNTERLSELLLRIRPMPAAAD